MTTLRAADLTALASADPLWRLRASGSTARASGEASALAESLGLPPRGFASPLGFWFAPAEHWASPPAYSLEVAAPTRLKTMSRIGPRAAKGPAPGTIRQARVTDRRRSDAPTPLGRRLALAIDGRSARVVVDEAAWPEAGQAALLAVATCWRLEALDLAFDRLTDQAREVVARGGRRSLSRHRQSGPPAPDLLRDGRALILDLPEFEGPLTDPSRFAPSREAARLYRRLCTRLHLDAWRDRIDERAEVLDDILDTLATRRDHRQVIALEVLIILLLAVDVALSQFLGGWE